MSDNPDERPEPVLPTKRFQKSGTCSTCDGDVRFYPAAVTEEQAIAEGTEPSGTWTHLDPADWVGNPHPVVVGE